MNKPGVDFQHSLPASAWVEKLFTAPGLSWIYLEFNSKAIKGSRGR